MMPITSASLKYTFDIDNIDKPSASSEIGMLIEEEYFYRFGLETSNRVSEIYYSKCLHSVILGDGDSIGKLDWAKPLFAYANKHHLRPTGKLLTSLIFVNIDQVTGKTVCCDEVWLPLK
ncbi:MULTISPECIES: hypothetical protein [Amylolactobacillus]|uniref:hypothetical protein n=1 Tax=Amylolactobacillus TaxID=2767876 RepID=UPI0012EC3CC9|nr:MULTISPECIES: hypothetical protein [Amylolactobacillus]